MPTNAASQQSARCSRSSFVIASKLEETPNKFKVTGGPPLRLDKKN